MAEDARLKAVLVDSDILIEVLRQRDAGLERRWHEVGESGALVLYSPVTAAETWQGVREREREQVSALFSEMTCVPIDAEIGRKAGDFLRLFRLSHSLELADAFIAATAAIHQAPLWTRNRRHYPMKEIRFYS